MSKKQSIKMVYPLTPMQEGILFHSLFDTDSNAYFEQMTLVAEGEVDHQFFEATFNLLIERYDILRTIFIHENLDRPRQVVLNQRTGRVTFRDLRDLEPHLQKEAIDRFREEDRLRKFNLSKDLLMRIAILQLRDDQYMIIWSHHHILMDGWCMGIIMKDFLEIYRAKLRKERPALTRVYPYGEYIKWLEKQNKRESLEYWKAYLAEYELTAEIPKYSTEKHTPEYLVSEEHFALGEELTSELMRYSRSNQVTLNTLFQTIWGVLLQRYNNVDDVVFGSVVSGRTSEIPGIEQMVGLFINTIPVRVNAASTDRFIDLMQKIQQQALASERYSYQPLAEIQAQTSLKHRLLSHIIVFENYPLEKEVQRADGSNDLPFRFTGFEMVEQTNYNLTVAVSPGSNLSVKLSYNRNIHQPSLMATIGVHFKNILQQLIKNKDCLLSEINLLSDDECSRILEKFNQTKKDYAYTGTLHGLFEEQVLHHHDQVGLLYQERELTYGELNHQANSLALLLREQGVKPNELVGVLATTSLEMVIGILGVLKAGGAYFPISPDLPRERIEFMLADTQARIVLKEPGLATEFSFTGEVIEISLSHARTESWENQPGMTNTGSRADLGLANGDLIGSIEQSAELINLPVLNTPDDLAYVIYTSGSTGHPKGVMIEHQAIINTLLWRREYYDLTDRDTVLPLLSFIFDASVLGLFTPLISGSKLILIDQDERLNLEYLKTQIITEQITHLHLTPRFYQTILSEITDTFQSLKAVTVGGESFSRELVNEHFRKLPNTKFVNEYGPTESSVCSTAYSFDSDNVQILIGQPISNVRCYVIGRSGQLQPIGVPGELCIGGSGLARAYLNRPDLTAKSFVQNPYTNEMMYHTGDLVRWNEAGQLEFLSRVDQQVKIRGYRIELGEIENQLLKHDDIKEAVVIDQEDQTGNRYLAAYLVAEQELSSEDLKQYLQKVLPEYMIPVSFTQLGEIPVTASGKIDRKALPTYEGIVMREYIPPVGQIEETLADIWSDILGVEKIGALDHFFELGGHSLKATSLVSRINKQLNVQVPLKEVFNHPTIRELAHFISRSDENIYAQIEVITKKEFYPVSSAQKRLYILNQLDQNSLSYNMPGALKIRGILDQTKLERTLQTLIMRHDAFRTSFEMVDGEVQQRVKDTVDFSIEYHKTEEQVEPVVKEFLRPFDLSQAPLLRVGYIDLGKESLLIFDMHHIISDGVSMGILTQEFIQLYAGMELPKLRVQYKDYSAWQNQLFESELIQKQEAYWLETFADEVPVLNLPTDYPRPAVQSFAGDQIEFSLGSEESHKLRQLVKATGATLYMVILAGLNVLLSKYSGQEDLIIGSPIAGRPHADLENIIGMFVNTLAMRNYPRKNKRFIDFLGEVKANGLKAYENQDYQFEMLVEKLDERHLLSKDLSRNPVFDVMFVLQNLQQGSARPVSGAFDQLKIEPYAFESKIAKFDLTFTAAERQDCIQFNLNYATHLFKQSTMERMARHLVKILTTVGEEPNILLNEIKMITDDERFKILQEFNATEMDYPAKTIHQLFREQARRSPDKTALVFKDQQMSYQELDMYSDLLAQRISTVGIGLERDEVIGLFFEPSCEMVISMLAVLKAGCAYLPIDPTYPEERVQFLLTDSALKLILTQSALKDSLNYSGKLIIADLNDLFDDLQVHTDSTDQSVNHNDATGLDSGSSEELSKTTSTSDLAYIIYTSGSTGTPKGVMVEQKNVVNLLYWFNQRFQLDQHQNVLQMTSYTFDPSVEQIFGTLCFGSTLFLIDSELKLNKKGLRDYLDQMQITMVNMVPSAFQEFLADEPKITSIRVLISGGEKLSEGLKNKLLAQGYQVFNHYGLTETTVEALTSQCSSEQVVLGQPITNTRCYILDQDNNLQPIGIVGEICLAGESIARGYLNRLELTAERFVSDPFFPEERMYRTGDLGRWLANGDVEYYGRSDSQVKIRGYRIELREIEHHLATYPGVIEGVVIDREHQGNRFLCGYLQSRDPNSELSMDEIRGYLARRLPGYMIPTFLIQIPSIPRTFNGKVDYKSLPQPSEMSITRNYVAPETEIEKELVEIWADLLGFDQLGVTDNFFELGGHSLKATTMISRVFKRLQVELPLREVFKTPTVRELAAYIQNREETIYASIKPVDQAESYPVSSAQKRLYILNQLEGMNTSYNMPGVLKIIGHLDLSRLEQVIQTLIQRHEAFRTSFVLINGEVKQKIHESVGFELQRYIGEEYQRSAMLSEEEVLEQIIQEFIQPFDLTRAPLLRVGLVDFAEEAVLIFDLHHIISDGVSMNILTNEFIQLYVGRELPELRIQYKDFSVWQNALFDSGKIDEQEAYWLDVFAAEVPVLNLPTDYPRPGAKNFVGEIYQFTLGTELTGKLRELVKAEGVTMYMVLLAGFNLLLSRYSGQDDISVGSPIAGRPHADLENIIGMFVNTLVMRNYPISSLTVQDFLAEVKERALRAYENQDYQFEMLVQKLDQRNLLTKDMSRNPLFDVLLVLQNTSSTQRNLPEPEELAELKFVPHVFENKIAKFDLTLSAMEGHEDIHLNFNYATQLFTSQTIQLMAEHYVNLLQGMVIDPQRQLAEVAMISDVERKELIDSLASADQRLPLSNHQVIQAVFEAQVEQQPDKIAILSSEGSLTYAELNGKANGLASMLRQKGVQPEQIVAIMVDRSFEMLFGILGILKAGGAYLPIDPNYPIDRIEYILQDSQAKILLTDDQYIVPESCTEKIDLINLTVECSLEVDNLPIVNKSTDLAYVLYTSGSTGKPKGVMIEHGSVINTLSHMQNRYPLNSDDIILQSTVYTFDASVREILWWFFGGAKCYLLEPDGEKYPEKIIQEIAQNQITVVKFVPILLNEILLTALSMPDYREKLKTLRYIFVGGEALTAKLVDTFYQTFDQHKRLINLYGPTETTIHCTEYEVTQPINRATAPIGRPISNNRVYVLDSAGSLVPKGVPGEIYIAGLGVGRGYLNNPDLSAEKFSNNPDTHEKMYRTGDIGRWLHDGNLEFLHRIDHQVKIRGFRIELGEIENRLLSYSGIQEAVVLDLTDDTGDKFLCGYVVCDDTLSIGGIRQYLQAELPEYMIPSQWVMLDRLPLTWNGKVDRKALPKPDALENQRDYSAPRDRIEGKLAEIYSEILAQPIVGIDDSFFELGGHSLKATALIAQAFRELNVEIPLRQIFKTPTIRQLAENIRTMRETVYSGIKPAEEQDYYPVSSAQRRLFILNQLNEQGLHYNMPMSLELGSDVDSALLEKSLERLIQRHEIFRTSFGVVNGEIVQKVHQAVEFHLEIIEVHDQQSVATVFHEFVQPFDLSQAPLFRVSLLKISGKSRRSILLCDMHHIISDGESMQILGRDLTRLYQGETLKELPLQYKDYAVWQWEMLMGNDLTKTQRLKEQATYWKQIFTNAITGKPNVTPLDLPTDYPRPPVRSFEGDVYEFAISAELTAKLKSFTKDTGATLYMVLLAVFNLLLSRYTAQEDIVIGTPSSGRLHPDLQEMIGMFVNTVPMRNYPENHKLFSEFVREVKEHVITAFENQDYQLDMLIDELDLSRDLSRNPLFDVVFTLQNFADHKEQQGSEDSEKLELVTKIAKFDLSLIGVEYEAGLSFGLEYSTRLFTERTIVAMAKHFTQIIETIAVNPEISLGEVQIITEEERTEILNVFNATQKDLPYQTTIYKLFEEQVALNPEQTAVIYQDQRLSYAELNQRANRLAHFLVTQSNQDSQVVAVMLERSQELLSTLIGIMKAGYAYLPVDHKYPLARVEYMLKDSKTKLLITDQKLDSELDFSGTVLNLSELDLELYAESNPLVNQSSEELAYVIYTSGSTGRPKGVLIEHQSICNTLLWRSTCYGFDEHRRILQVMPHVFDGSVVDIFTPLVSGSTIIMPEETRILELEHLRELMIRYEVNYLLCTPKFYQTIFAEIADVLSNLDIVNLAGEGFSSELIREHYQKFPDVRLFNEYGPTENSVSTALNECQGDDEVVLVGRPNPNVECYVVSKNNHLQPVGVPGELWVSGVGVARGYLYRPELTAEKFIPNSIANTYSRIYKTGDLVKWHADGRLEFLGRVDQQVKIRGFRIELGEIENQLLQIKDVREVVVVDQKDDQGNLYLVAYLVTDAVLSIPELKASLALTLPEYMVPAYFTTIEEIPLTTNGKVDRAALPKPLGLSTDRAYVPPANKIEETLVEIWSEILGVQQIGVTDNFFELGGHSLRATTMVSRIYKKLNVELALREVFKSPTIRELTRLIKTSQKRMFTSIQPVEKSEYYPVSSAQKRLYVLNQLDDSTTSYNMPGALKLNGKLNRERLAEVLVHLVARHEAFRTSFKMIDGEVRQCIADNLELVIEEYQLQTTDELAKIMERFIRPFDLSEAPLLRVGIIECLTETILIYDMHHIISDGVSMSILTNDFSQLYAEQELAELRIQYKDFAVWQNELFASEQIKEQESYWLETFDEVPVLNLMPDFPRPAVKNYAGQKYEFRLDTELTKKLDHLVKAQGATMFMALLAGFTILLSRYSAQEDIVIGTPIAGRPHVDLEKIIGMFVNTLAFRNFPRANMTCQEFLGEVRDRALQAYENQDYQFEMLVERLDQLKLITGDLSRNPIFDVMFVMQNIELENNSQSGVEDPSESGGSPYHFENQAAKFDLTLTASETKTNITLTMTYATQLFKNETIKRMAEHYVNILRAMVEKPELDLHQIQMLSSAERNYLIHELAVESNSVSPKGYCGIQEIFEEQVRRTPHQRALIRQGDLLTYNELNQRANQLAAKLRSQGVGANQIVGMMVERSFEMIIGILAIFKAGGAYLPIDPNYPVDRIEYILTDSHASWLLVDRRSIILENYQGEVIDLTDVGIYAGPDTNITNCSKPEDLAYVLYTSGSTGKPKGVMVEHHSLINTISHLQDRYPLCEADIILQSTVYTFDASVRELVWWFFGGASCYLLEPDEEKFPAKIIDTIAKHQVTVVKFVPILLNEILLTALEIKDYQQRLSSLRYIFVGGEALTAKVVERFYQVFSKDQKFINLYGPTETTVHCSEYQLTSEITQAFAPIGRPISNTELYVLDAYLNPIPLGVPGEIYVAGEGVARGYLNQVELMEDKFITSPFTSQPMYRTGDIGRWLSDGNLEFLHRVDHQVKIRGFRIELGEIENQLLRHPLIKEAVVIDYVDNSAFGIGQRYLCGYLVTDDSVTHSELRKHLLNELPEYMVPAQFIYLDSLPLTWNGKVDRKALPTPASQQNIRAYSPPRNHLEERLAGIWRDLLGVEQVGIDDNFFELGGHSLKATSFISKTFKELHVQIPLRQVFKSPTIRELAQYINNIDQVVYSGIKPVEIREYYPVSAAQKRLFILHQMNEEGIHYNMPGGMKLQGQLDRARLAESFLKLIDRHEILRTSFTVVNGQIVQRVHSSIEFMLQHYTVTTAEEVSQCLQEFVQPFDLGRAPLLRAGLIDGLEQQILIYDLHHIVADGESMGILIKDFLDILTGRDVSDLRIQYKDYAVWQQAMFEEENPSIEGGQNRLKDQELYWLQNFTDSKTGMRSVPVLNLPTDYPRPSVQSYEGDVVRFELSTELVAQLNQLAKERNLTLYMLLLAGYALLLSKYSGQEDIVIGSPTSGRLHPDLEKMIGMFVNTLPMRMNITYSLNFTEFMNEVREKVLQAFENQDYQFDMLVDKLELERDLSRNPLFDTMFTLQNYGQAKKHSASMEGLSLQVAKFDLSLIGVELEERLEFSFEYCTRLFKKATIERMLNHYTQILQVIVSEPEILLADIGLITPEEKAIILGEFNNTGVQYPKNISLAELFSEQVERTPDRPALVFADQVLTYHELAERVETLAYELRTQGVIRDQIIGLFVEPSFEMVIGILGIIKAGGGYLPIDPAYPKERINYILADSQVELILTQSWLSDEITDLARIVVLDNLELSQKSVDSEVVVINQPEDLAYIIYTSGSTGQPKGVMVEQQNVVNLINWFNQQYHLDQGQRVLQMTNYTFDPSVEQIFGTLCYGSTLYLIRPEEKLDKARFREYLSTNQIGIVNMVPSACKELLLHEAKIESVHTLICGGEKLEEGLKDQLLSLGYSVYNHYGLTETTVEGLFTACTSAKVLLGRPIANTRCYILDQRDHLQPIGVIGEICLAGESVARGYLHQRELTEQRFVYDPFVQGERMYRTGDLGRWTADGQVEYFGRVDSQVKIRGFRIELAEIEYHLNSFTGIREAVVLPQADEEDNSFLCAYLVCSEELQVPLIREFLAQNLPSYMIPTYYLFLEKIPLTTNGKVDHKALPKPTQGLQQREYVSPCSMLEEQLASIWSAVLGVKPIGVTDNFFEIGGHSLKATALIAKIYKELKLEVPLRVIFKTPTIRMMANYILTVKESLYSAIPVAEPEDYYPVSSAQRRLYILHQLNDVETTYNMPTMIPLQDDVEILVLEQCFKQLIQRHEALRTSFEMVNGEIVQKVHSIVDFTIEEIWVEDQESFKQMMTRFVRPFDLSQAPLIRAAIFKGNGINCGSLLIIDLHHIISDGESMKILQADFVRIYQGQQLPELKIQYKDVAVWQNNILNSKQHNLLKTQEAYWKGIFIDHHSGELNIPILNLPTDYPRPSVMSFEGSTYTFALNRELTSGLNELAKANQTTLYMALVALFSTLLGKYSAQEDIIIGSPTTGRFHPDVEKIIGMFVNTLPLRNQPVTALPFDEFLTQVKDNVLSAFENQDYQFDMLIDHLDLDRDLSRNPLFDVMFSWQNYSGQQISQESIQSLITNSTAKFDLTLIGVETESEIQLAWSYRTKLFKHETITRMAKHLIQIVEEVVKHPKIQLSEISMLTFEEQQTILQKFNQPVEILTETTLPELFVRQAQKTPDKTALLVDQKPVTYQELNQYTNTIVQFLQQNGVERGQVVGIMVESSLATVVGILGILKTGAAYLPLSNQYPQERMEFMLQDANAKVLLTQGVNQFTLDFPGQILSLDDAMVDLAQDNLHELDISAQLCIDSNDLAYIIYTSGSTGKPKGVMVQHKAIVNTLLWRGQYYQFAEDTVTVQTMPFIFDGSLTDLFTPLLHGAKVILVSDEERMKLQRLGDIICQEQVTHLLMTPKYYESLLLQASNMLGNLKVVSLAGESFGLSLVQTHFNRLNSVRLVNEYGPTENSVCTTVYELSADEQQVLIGQPISNVQCYVRSITGSGQLLPIGVPGELCVAGAGLSLGYLNQRELTAEKFIANPYNSDLDLMYRTGDLVRWHEDGNLEFLGRIDQQVKIRGYRIEVGEIEQVLLADPQITEVVIIDRESQDGDKYLTAYLVANQELEITVIKNRLSLSLPEYMIPTYIIQVEQIPLSPTGKVDRHALPDPSELLLAREYVAPTSEVEARLTELWSEVLGLETIGVTDNFFEIGGHSLKATALLPKIYQEFETNLALRDIFKAPTIRQMAEYLNTHDQQPSLQDDNLVLLRQGAEDQHVFLIHGGDGGVESYLELVEHLDAHYTYWGIKASPLVNAAPANRSIEQMASSYLQKIKHIQKSGPYRILGWSLGGLITLELAQQLEAIGEVIELAGIIDSTPPRAKEQAQVLEFTVHSELELLNQIFGEVNLPTSVKTFTTVEELWDMLKTKIEELNLNPAHLKARIPEHVARMIPHYHDLPITELIYHLNLMRTFDQAVGAYWVKGRVAGQLVVFNTEDSKDAIHWKSWADEVDIYTLLGDHYSILTAPEVTEIAKILNQLMLL